MFHTKKHDQRVNKHTPATHAPNVIRKVETVKLKSGYFLLTIIPKRTVERIAHLLKVKKLYNETNLETKNYFTVGY